MKNIVILLSLSLIVIILFCPSCDPDYCADTCVPPEGIAIDTATFDSSEDQNLITFSWPPAPEANTYNLTLFVDDAPYATINSIIGTTYTAVFSPALNMDAMVSAKISSNCNCLGSPDSPLYDFFYKNGGGTLDIVPFALNINSICESNCDFIRFEDRDQVVCDQTLILPYAQYGYIAYEREALCSCLNYDPCSVAPSLSFCLNSTQKNIKTSWLSCGSN